MKNDPKYSIVVPVYNEEESIPELYRRITDTMQKEQGSYEIVFVDDCSQDNSLAIIKKIAVEDKQIIYLSFTRNFGHEIATTAGIEHATGDAIVIIDADLQDPPEYISRLIKEWLKGHKIVLAKRRKREGETYIKKVSSKLFYLLLNKLTEFDLPRDVGDFRLIDKIVANDFLRCKENNRFVRGLVAWTGYPSATIEFDREKRFKGQTKYNYFKLFKLTVNSILAFSTVPLHIASLIGFLMTLFSIIGMLVIGIQKIFFGLVVEGYAFLMVSVFLLSGIQLLIIGIFGEYLAKIYKEIQKRPLYLLKEKKVKRKK